MQNGSAEAFTALYRHYAPQLYVHILRMTADEGIAKEILQDIFSRIWFRKENLCMDANFAGYLIRVAQHSVYNFYKKLRRNQSLLLSFKKSIQENYSYIEEALQYQESSELLEKALATLAPQQNKVYRLIKIEGHSYKETAEMLGIAPGTVKEYLVNANKVIRKYLTSNADGALGLLLLYSIKIGLN